MTLDVDERKNQLTKVLSEQYAQNAISIEEYERLIEYINKIQTVKELGAIEKIIQEYNQDDNETSLADNEKKNITIFSWRSTNIKPVNRNAGKYVSLFGTNRIIINERDLPKGKTVLNVSSIFGLMEICVSRKIKIINRTVPIFSGIFMPHTTDENNDERPELHIHGKAVFGNITIKFID